MGVTGEQQSAYELVILPDLYLSHLEPLPSKAGNSEMEFSFYMTGPRAPLRKYFTQKVCLSVATYLLHDLGSNEALF